MTAQRIILIILAIGMGVVALILSAETLIRIGLMDDSLTSEVEMTRKVAHAEVAVLRIILATLGVVLIAVALFREQISESGPYKWLMRPDIPVPASYEAALRRLAGPEAAILGVAIISMLVYVRVGADIFTVDQLLAINLEDGILEWVSAVFLLLASLMSFFAARAIGRGHPRYNMHIFLTVLFFLMFGEEISWGQRVFGFGTPEALQAVNVQSEINLHNMFGYLFDHVFILLFLVWAACVPLAYQIVPPLRQVILRLGVPVPSAGLAVAMTISGLMLDPIVYRFLEPLPTLRLAEARETLATLAFLVLMMEVRRHYINAGKPEVG